jgi:hypothetical protein
MYIYIYMDEIFYWGFYFLNRAFHYYMRAKTNKYTNYSFILLIMCGSLYMFRHYIAIIRERH